MPATRRWGSVWAESSQHRGSTQRLPPASRASQGQTAESAGSIAVIADQRKSLEPSHPSPFIEEAWTSDPSPSRVPRQSARREGEGERGAASHVVRQPGGPMRRCGCGRLARMVALQHGGAGRCRMTLIRRSRGGSRGDHVARTSRTAGGTPAPQRARAATIRRARTVRPGRIHLARAIHEVSSRTAGGAIVVMFLARNGSEGDLAVRRATVSRKRRHALRTPTCSRSLMNGG